MDLLAQIAEVVGPNGLITGDDVASRPTNWMGFGNQAAKAIVRPASTEEVSAVMRLCHDAGQSIVPMGGLSGLVQGAEAGPDDFLLSLERMRQIESVDTDGATMTVQAGVALQTVQERATEEGFTFPLDLGARGSAQIGGLMSTNAGGNQVIRYGMMREQVLGLEVVLADGAVLSNMNRMLKNNAGYDLKQLFIGSEGTLGVITKAVLRLRPAMASDDTALLGVSDFSAIPRLLHHFSSQLGGTMTAFEVMWDSYMEEILAGNANHHRPLADKYPFYILAEAEGGNAELDSQRFASALESAFEDGLIADAVIATSKDQRDALWAIREDIITLVVHLLPSGSFDVSLPIADMDAYVKAVYAQVADKWDGKARAVVFGHLGDSNIHLAVGTGVENELDHHDVERIVYDNLTPFGGSVSAEHGIGLEKRSWLATSRSESEIALMRTLKQAMDPKNILNPGKVIG